LLRVSRTTDEFLKDDRYGRYALEGPLSILKQCKDLAWNPSGLDMGQDAAMSMLELLGIPPGGQFARKTSQEVARLRVEKIAKMMLHLIG
jgi:hypothetical protein